MHPSRRRDFGWLRAWQLWAALSAACLLTDMALIYAATRIPMPDVGCTVPLPAGKGELLHQWFESVDRVTGVADGFAVASVLFLLGGMIIARGRARLFLLLAPVLVLALLGHANARDITGAWCADN